MQQVAYRDRKDRKQRLGVSQDVAIGKDGRQQTPNRRGDREDKKVGKNDFTTISMLKQDRNKREGRWYFMQEHAAQ